VLLAIAFAVNLLVTLAQQREEAKGAGASQGAPATEERTGPGSRPSGAARSSS
jgi:hypothetical protein